MGAMIPDQALSGHFRSFAAVVERDGGTTYPAICRAVADDPDVLALLGLAPEAQRRPLLLLAAVHDLLLGGTDHPLAAFYDTVAAIRDIRPSSDTGDVGDVFIDFCRTYRSQLASSISTRSTQTNEVGRCTALLPGLGHIASLEGGAPLDLLDLGTSAGLTLLFDEYAYTYRVEHGPVCSVSTRASGVALECTLRGQPHHLPPLRVPAVGARIGLDLDPVDVLDESQARWLLACQWPDNPVRFGRLCAALAQARRSPHRPRLERGDMVDDLAAVAETLSSSGPLVVFHSWAAAYLDADRQRALVDAVRELGWRRPVHHLYCEAPFETPGLPTPPSPVARDGPDLATALVHIGPDRQATRLADTHPHGYWLRWWPSPDGR